MEMTYSAALNAAYNTPILKYIGFNKEQAGQHMQSANAFLFLVMDIRKNGAREPYVTRALQHLQNVLRGGNEPGIDAMQIWAYPIHTCAITLCKYTPAIWGRLSDQEIERCDLLMQAHGVMSNFAVNDANNYGTGISLRGDCWKNRSPNYRLSLTIPGIAAAHYFGGADELDNLLTGFDYDVFISKAQEFGFKNLLGVWTTPSFEKNGVVGPGAKELLTTECTAYVLSRMPMDKGNIYKVGRGKGAKIPFVYQGHRADSVGIVEYLTRFNHSGGACVSHSEDLGDGTYTCYTIDGSTSSAEGKEGMLREYNGFDIALRSDAFYCTNDFCMEIALLIMCKELGVWVEDENPELYEIIYSGNVDHIHKFSIGYMSQGMGHQRIERENNMRGYYYAKALWEKYFPIVEV